MGLRVRLGSLLITAILVQAVVPWSLDLAAWRDELRGLAVKAGCTPSPDPSEPRERQPSDVQVTIRADRGEAVITAGCQTEPPK